MKPLLLNSKILALKTDLFFVEKIFETYNLSKMDNLKISRGVVLSDDTVAKQYEGAFKKMFANEPIPLELLSFPSKEASKSREMKQFLEDELLKKKCGRDTLLIACGGGVTTDLVGYLASTYMRGVPLIFIPTTLLAMVDAAIGGKTGVNTPFGKNSIGAFYPPKAIFIDLHFLKTLPQKEWMNGLAEMAKYGLIANEAHFEKLEAHPADWQKQDLLRELILTSIQAKIDVVERDPFETGYRRILNFGHTVGHALELISDYEMAHGEAVALGCMAESFLSCHLGYLPKAALQRILAFYFSLRFSFKLPKNFTRQTFLDALASDKKSKGSEIRCTLIDRIGSCIPFEGAYCRALEKKDLDALLDWMESMNG
ncbi:MAG: 3-dehydroquinate synthase [Chlamydiota bacterium]